MGSMHRDSFNYIKIVLKLLYIIYILLLIITILTQGLELRLMIRLIGFLSSDEYFLTLTRTRS